MCNSPLLEARHELGLPSDVQAVLVQSLLEANLAAAQTHVRRLYSICRPENTHWRVRRAAQRALRDLRDKPEEHGTGAHLVVNCVRQLIGDSRTDELLVGLYCSSSS